MKEAGYTAAAIGAAIALFSLLMKTSLPSSSEFGEVINIGLLQNQALVFQGGCFLFLAGVVLAAAGLIVDQLRIGAVARGTDAGAPAPEPEPVAFESQVAALHPPEPYTPIESAAADRLALQIAGILLLVVVAIGLYVTWGGSSAGGRDPAVQAAVANNANALADEMERQADNLDAMADVEEQK